MRATAAPPSMLTDQYSSARRIVMTRQVNSSGWKLNVYKNSEGAFRPCTTLFISLTSVLNDFLDVQRPFRPEPF